MINFYLVVIIVNAQGAAAPVVQKSDPGLNYRCEKCGWWNTYDNLTSFRIGSKAHFRRCPMK